MKQWREALRSDILRRLLLVMMLLTLVPLLILGGLFLWGQLKDAVAYMPWAFAIVILLAAAGILAAAYFLYDYLAGPLLRLRDVASKVSMGDYSQDITRLIGPRRDEIGEFSEAFNLMVTMIEARETSLRAQVQRLQIEIDESRKAEQVSKITESDYFKDLRQRARELRRRRKGEATEEGE